MMCPSPCVFLSAPSHTGWMDVRLLAPRAELRVQVAGGSSMIDSGRLSYLGEALRALLVLEVRWLGRHKEGMAGREGGARAPTPSVSGFVSRPVYAAGGLLRWLGSLLSLMSCGVINHHHNLAQLHAACPCLLPMRTQARRARLLSCAPPAVPPTHLYEGCQALRCEVQTASGARLVVVIGGPPAVLANQPLVEHALRQTLVADALSLQFRLPPPGVPPPLPRSNADVLGGCPVVDALLLTSVWAVSALRQLAQVCLSVCVGRGGVGGMNLQNAPGVCCFALPTHLCARPC